MVLIAKTLSKVFYSALNINMFYAISVCEWWAGGRGDWNVIFGLPTFHSNMINSSTCGSGDSVQAHIPNCARS